MSAFLHLNEQSKLQGSCSSIWGTVTVYAPVYVAVASIYEATDTVYAPVYVTVASVYVATATVNAPICEAVASVYGAQIQYMLYLLMYLN